jgi:phospholipid/cholesterol/gamma-HCH transport system ATP-binding protein
MNKSERKKIRTQIGMLFQGSALFDSYSVEQNVLFPLTMFTDMSKEEMLERVNFCLKRVELENKNHLFPSEISGGMQKRVAIARAIALNPQYLFCDEPNSGLDPKTSIVIDNLIHDLTKEYDMTTVVITHDMNSVMEIGENILYIHEGENWWTGDNHSIVTTNNQEIGDFVYASEFMKQLRGKLI